MNVEAIGAIQSEPSLLLGRSSSLTTRPEVRTQDFGALVSEEITAVDHRIHAAEQAVRDLALGRSDSIHGAMLTLERAKTSLEFVVQVRNRLLEAYQEVVRMQI